WLFLPLLGGYIFYTRFCALSFSSSRSSGQRLLFNAGVCGLGLLLLSQLLILTTLEYRDGLIFRISNLVFGAAVTMLIALYETFIDSRKIQTFAQDLSRAPWKKAGGCLLALAAT